MFWVLALIVVAAAIIFRRQIARNLRNSAGLFGGLLSVYFIHKIFQRDPAFGITPKWVAAVGLVVAFICGVKLFRSISNEMWPKEPGDKNVSKHQ